MATLILVPGAMHGAWVWRRITPLLEQAGHQVVALDLPGMGPHRDIAMADVTLGLWGDAVAEQVRCARQPVILAAHSRGGLVIGEAAERVPELLLGLIYVAAVIVPPGETVMSLGRPEGAPKPAAGTGSGAAVTLPPEQATAMFYNCCTPEDAAWAVSQLEPEPPAPLVTPASVTWERWGRTPRAYIECRQDQTLPLDRQRRLQAAAPCDPVIQLDTDHSPFLSAPTALAQAMVAIARTWA